MNDYKKWVQDVLFQHHVLTRVMNREGSSVSWCVCPIEDYHVGEPLVFGTSIDETIENFKNFLEINEEEPNVLG